MITLTVDRMAHGGHAVGRHEGQVVFVRGAIPGETVVARVTGSGRKNRYLFAEVDSVVVASPDRVEPPCPLAGTCGGCDFQHVSLVRQRALKSEVLSEQLERLAGVTMTVPVTAVGDGGLHWRTRMRFAADGGGGWGLRRHGSHEVVTVLTCPIATPQVDQALGSAGASKPGEQLIVVDQPGGPVTRRTPGADRASVVASAGGRRWELDAASFWQAHPQAGDVLAAAVAPHVVDADVWWDLYCGVGLFAGSLARPGQSVLGVEGDRKAVQYARRNLADLPDVRIVADDVGKWLQRPVRQQPDAVVLDPPRSGAGRAVVSALTGTAARIAVYVACDPAALGRDVGYFVAAGWQLTSVTGFDLFPMTHHVEAVAVLTR